MYRKVRVIQNAAFRTDITRPDPLAAADRHKITCNYAGWVKIREL
ncbi:MAG: hypothetical protein NWQ23_06400 [Yoonia sp.]|nr:hypothetical protein [Yoonia sp.]MDP5085034.1 hypothetical protein [Yoonia sp.]